MRNIWLPDHIRDSHRGTSWLQISTPITIEETSRFRKHYYQRIRVSSMLVDEFRLSVNTFALNPFAPHLNLHPLARDLKGYYAINIDSDYRIILKPHKGKVVFYDVGNHHQVYGV